MKCGPLLKVKNYSENAIATTFFIINIFKMLNTRALNKCIDKTAIKELGVGKRNKLASPEGDGMFIRLNPIHLIT